PATITCPPQDHDEVPSGVVVMPLRWTLLLLCLLGAGLLFRPETPLTGADKKAPAALGKEIPAGSFTHQVVPFMKKYCVRCHGGRKPRRGLNLTKYQAEESLTKDRDLWEKVIRNVRNRDMPPEGRRQPSQPEIDQVTGFLHSRLEPVDCTLTKDPGRVTIRR